MSNCLIWASNNRLSIWCFTVNLTRGSVIADIFATTERPNISSAVFGLVSALDAIGLLAIVLNISSSCWARSSDLDDVDVFPFPFPLLVVLAIGTEEDRLEGWLAEGVVTGVNGGGVVGPSVLIASSSPSRPSS